MQQLSGLDGAVPHHGVRHGVRARRQRVHPRHPHRPAPAHAAPPHPRHRVAAAAGAAVPSAAGARCRSGWTSRTGSTTRTSTSSSTCGSWRCPTPAATPSSPSRWPPCTRGRWTARRPLWELYLISGLQRPPGRDLLQDPPRRDRRGVRRRHAHRRAGPHPGGPPGARGRSLPGEQPPGRPARALLGRSAATLAMQPLRATRLATELARRCRGLALAARPLAAAGSPGRHRRRPDVRARGCGLRARRSTPHHGAPALGLRRPPLAEVKEVRARHRAHRQRRRHGAVRGRAASLAARTTTRCRRGAGGGRAGVGAHASRPGRATATRSR